MTKRRTLAREAYAEGVALHAGVRTRIWLKPAPPGAGIVFRRMDVDRTIPALWNNTSPEQLNTVLVASDGTAIKLVEHVMAAIAGAEVDDCIIDIDGVEPPILDGAALEYLDHIAQAGMREQDVDREVCVVRKIVEVTDGSARIRLTPCGDHRQFRFEIEFPETGRQVLEWTFTPGAFRRDIAPARTFGRMEDRERYAAAGYGRGANFDNTLVFEGGELANAKMQRFPDEFVRHKVLDAVGDLALAGYPILGRFEGYRSSHRLNAELLRALFADAANYEILLG